ncbi:helix-turn-helix transcriptional regulator [Butyrivibrio sp. FCS014]|uniref:helix-turn-helix transcriptional regulator n=1 Tax=Butyrivibrio sp. FCS014 TaxID=1408304 RepID=UPI000466BC3C|nr:helix-turn-helix transcriptional regulator [Butyrivibrio sp. FCS014]
MAEAIRNNLEELNSIFRFHRLFESGTSFTDVLDIKRFMAVPEDSFDPLLLSAVFGGAITYGIPTTFECINNPYYLLLYIEKGDVLIKSEESMLLKEKSMALFKPGVNFRFDTRSTPCFFHLFLLTGEPLRLYIQKPMEVIELKERHANAQLSYLQRLMLRQGADSGILRSRLLTDILTEAYLAVADTKVPSATPGIPAHIQDMKAILDTEYNSFLTLDNLEERLFVSKYRLCRQFKNYYGHSPLQYLNNLRIEQAKTLLEQTDISVNAVGCDVGIPNTSHFIKLFKRETTLTPAEYRKKKSS